MRQLNHREIEGCQLYLWCFPLPPSPLGTRHIFYWLQPLQPLTPNCHHHRDDAHSCVSNNSHDYTSQPQNQFRWELQLRSQPWLPHAFWQHQAPFPRKRWHSWPLSLSPKGPFSLQVPGSPGHSFPSAVQMNLGSLGRSFSYWIGSSATCSRVYVCTYMCTSLPGLS